MADTVETLDAQPVEQPQAEPSSENQAGPSKKRASKGKRNGKGRSRQGGKRRQASVPSESDQKAMADELEDKRKEYDEGGFSKYCNDNVEKLLAKRKANKADAASQQADMERIRTLDGNRNDQMSNMAMMMLMRGMTGENMMGSLGMFLGMMAMKSLMDKAERRNARIAENKAKRQERREAREMKVAELKDRMETRRKIKDGEIELSDDEKVDYGFGVQGSVYDNVIQSAARGVVSSAMSFMRDFDMARSTGGGETPEEVAERFGMGVEQAAWVCDNVISRIAQSGIAGMPRYVSPDTLAMLNISCIDDQSEVWFDKDASDPERVHAASALTDSLRSVCDAQGMSDAVLQEVTLSKVMERFTDNGKCSDEQFEMLTDYLGKLDAFSAPAGFEREGRPAMRFMLVKDPDGYVSFSADPSKDYYAPSSSPTTPYCWFSAREPVTLDNVAKGVNKQLTRWGEWAYECGAYDDYAELIECAYDGSDLPQENRFAGMYEQWLTEEVFPACLQDEFPDGDFPQGDAMRMFKDAFHAQVAKGVYDPSADTDPWRVAFEPVIDMMDTPNGRVSKYNLRFSQLMTGIHAEADKLGKLQDSDMQNLYAVCMVSEPNNPQTGIPLDPNKPFFDEAKQIIELNTRAVYDGAPRVSVASVTVDAMCGICESHRMDIDAQSAIDEANGHQSYHIDGTPLWKVLPQEMRVWEKLNADPDNPQPKPKNMPANINVFDNEMPPRPWWGNAEGRNPSGNDYKEGPKARHVHETWEPQAQVSDDMALPDMSSMVVYSGGPEDDPVYEI